MRYHYAILAFVVALFATSVKAHEIETGIGVVCDRRDQIERFAQLFGNPEALQTINADAPRACALVEVAYIRGASHRHLFTASGKKSTVAVTEILVVGFKSNGEWHQLAPTIQWTLVPIKEEDA